MDKKNDGPSRKEMSASSDITALIIILVLYTCGCGSERIFQAMEFIFGLCGPLKMNPNQAVFIDECYNGGYMLGRYSLTPSGTID